MLQIGIRPKRKYGVSAAVFIDAVPERLPEAKLPLAFWAAGIGVAGFKLNKTVAFRTLLPKRTFSVFQKLTVQAFFQSFSYLLPLHTL